MELKLVSRQASGNSKHSKQPPKRMLERRSHTISGLPVSVWDDSFVILLAHPYGKNYKGVGINKPRDEAIQSLTEMLEEKGISGYPIEWMDDAGPHPLYGERGLPRKLDDDDLKIGYLGFVRARVLVPAEEVWHQKEERRWPEDD